MSDPREGILNGYQTIISESDIECISKEDAKDAMDDYMKECCTQLIEYMAKNKIELDIVNGEVECYLKNGEGISREQLFQNFL